ncbi:Conserved_hypothetical protein [Hexamita inflata]|uniref:Uncharacterized protein n=1 Tax=Hexamita inflata TaxID=28002 RepID=A0AA86P0Y8_9EUKA|nr:Conserved hypothetical protein [Hexamita inflata]
MTDLWQKLKFSEQEASLNYQIMQRNVSEQTEYVRVLTDAVGLSEEYQAYEKDFISARNHINFALENPTRTTKYTPKSLCTALVRIKSCLNNMVLLTKLARHIAHHPVSLPYFEVTAENPLALIYKDNVLNQLNIAILLELSGFCHTESVKLVNAWFENGTKHIPSPTKLRLMFLLGLDYPPLITPSRQLSQRFDAYCFLTAGFEQLVDQVNRNSIFDACVHEYNTVTQYQLKMRTQKLTPLKIPHFTDYIPLFKTEPVPNFTMSEYDYQMYVIQKERDLKSQQLLQNAITYQLFKQDEPLHREPKQLKLKPTEEEKKTEHTLQFLKRSQNVGRPQTSFKDQKLNQRPVNQFSSIKLKPTAYMVPDDVEVPQEYKYVDYIYEDQEDEEEMEEPEIYEHEYINAHAKGMSPEVQLKSPVRKITNNSVEIYEDNEDSIPIQHEQTIRILNNSDVINTQKFNLNYMDSPQLQSKESMKSPEKKQDSPIQMQKEVKTPKTPKKEEAKAAAKPVEVKKEDSFDDEPVQKEVKSAKPPKKEEAKAAAKPVEVKKEDSFDDEPVQKEVKSAKPPKKEEAKAAAKPVEVKKEDSFDDEPVQKEVKSAKPPKKEEAKAAAKPVEVKKEDSFDDEPVQKEVKTSKTPKKEEAKAAAKPVEVKKEDSFDDEPVQKEVKTSKTPKKEEAKAAAKPVEVKKEDSFDDEPVQKEVKTSKTPKKEEAKAAAKPVEVKKEDSFDDEPVQKEVKSAKHRRRKKPRQLPNQLKQRRKIRSMTNQSRKK